MRIGTLLCVVLLAAACGDDDRRPTGDAGREIRVDSGGMTGRDSGPGGGGDAGPGGMCPPMPVPLPMGNICAMSTLTCLMGATTPAAQQMCLMMDPRGADCAACLDQEILNCATNPPGMCADEWGNFVCCGMNMCAGLSGMALTTCVQSMCSSQLMAVQTCVNATAGCNMISGLCFMMSGMARPEIGEPGLECSYEAHMLEYGVRYLQSHGR
jgi:hypothetical protein